MSIMNFIVCFRRISILSFQVMQSFYQSSNSPFGQLTHQNSENLISDLNQQISVNNKPKIFKRIGARPVIRPFSKEFKLCPVAHPQTNDHNNQTQNHHSVHQYPSTKKFLVKGNPDKKLKRIGKKLWITAYKQQLTEQESNEISREQIAEKKLSNHPSYLQKQYGKIPSININSNQQSILQISQQENQHEFHEFHEEFVESSSKCNTPMMIKQEDDIFDYSVIAQENLIPTREKLSTVKKQESFAQKFEISDEQAEDILEDIHPNILEDYEKKIDEYMQQNYIKRSSVKKQINKRKSKRQSRIKKNELQQQSNCQERKKSIKKSIAKKPLPSPYPFNQEVGLTHSLPIKSQSLHTSINQPTNFDHQNSTDSIILHSPFRKPPTQIKENSKTQIYFSGKSMSQHVKNKTFKKIDKKDQSVSASTSKLQRHKKLQINRYILDAKKQINSNSPYR